MARYGQKSKSKKWIVISLLAFRIRDSTVFQTKTNRNPPGSVKIAIPNWIVSTQKTRFSKKSKWTDEVF